MTELDLSSLPTAMSSSVCAWNLEWILALSMSWLKYPIENSSNHVLESSLELWTISNGVASLRPIQPGTWFRIIAAFFTARYQNYRPTWFSVMNARVIWIKVRRVRSASPFEDWSPAGAAMMLEPFDNINRREFTLFNLLSKSEWNRWGRRPASTLNIFNAEFIDVDDSDDIL